MKALAIIAVLALACIGGEAQAEDKFDGVHLLRACSSVERYAEGQRAKVLDWDSTHDFYSCLAYVKGVVNTMDFLQSERLCYPAESTLGQWALVFVKYLREHPKTLHQPGNLLVSAALVDAYPCR